MISIHFGCVRIKNLQLSLPRNLRISLKFSKQLLPYLCFWDTMYILTDILDSNFVIKFSLNLRPTNNKIKE